MNVFVVGKPNYNYIMTGNTVPGPGETVVSTERNEMPGGVSVYVACMLAKWGINVRFAGMVSGDETGIKIKNTLEKYGVDVHNLELNYEVSNNTDYIMLNSETGVSTHMLYDNDKFLTKFRFDVLPDYVIVEGSDIGAGIGCSNNYPNAKIIFLADKLKEEYADMSKRCDYVLATLPFARALSKVDASVKKPKSLVNMLQKIKDLNKGTYTVMMKEDGVLYVKDHQVKMIPAVNVLCKDADNYYPAFYAAYCYGILKNFDMDITAKISNMAGFVGTGRVGSITSIPDKKYVFDNCGLTEPEDENADVTVTGEEKGEVAIEDDKPAEVEEVHDTSNSFDVVTEDAGNAFNSVPTEDSPEITSTGGTTEVVEPPHVDTPQVAETVTDTVVPETVMKSEASIEMPSSNENVTNKVESLDMPATAETLDMPVAATEAETLDLPKANNTESMEMPTMNNEVSSPFAPEGSTGNMFDTDNN